MAVDANYVDAARGYRCSFPSESSVHCLSPAARHQRVQAMSLVGRSGALRCHGR